MCRTRIFSGTQIGKLVALDARTGRLCPGFGTGGVVNVAGDLKLAVSGEVGIKAAPAVLKGVVVVGSAIRDLDRSDAPSGRVRAYDLRSGELRWEWDPVPRDPSNPAYATWQPGSAERHGAANVWATMAVDPETDTIYLPTSSPSVDVWGGDRKGDNLHANSLVALDGATGRIKWHFQIVRHDLWDYDLAAQPVLANLVIGSQPRRAVIQATKMGLVFVLDRDTGKPIHPVENRPVPASDVPGELASPTQRFPTVIPPLGPLGLKPEDAWGPFGIGRQECADRIAELRHDGMYAPPSLRGTVMMPTPLGGVNWGGGAVDPRSGIMIVNSTRIAGYWQLVPREPNASDQSQIDLGAAEVNITHPMRGTPFKAQFKPLMSRFGLPCNAPPWGVIQAIDLASGRILWEKPFGSTAATTLIPLFRGMPSLGGPLLTSTGLAFIGAAMDDWLRAYDIHSGEELWSAQLPAGGQASPMTYAIGGRQYVVIAAGGHFGLQTTPGASLVAYALPADVIVP